MAKANKETAEFKYTIRSGAPFKQEEAPEIAQALMDILAAHGGKLTAHAVVEAAEQEDHPLHQYFEWDDARAAKRYRLQQARQLIKAVQYKVKAGKVEIDTAAFVRIFNADQLPQASPGPGYVPLPVAVEVVDFKEQMLARALQELNSFKARYRTISMTCTELRPILEAIGTMQGLLEERRQKGQTG